MIYFLSKSATSIVRAVLLCVLGVGALVLPDRSLALDDSAFSQGEFAVASRAWNADSYSEQGHNEFNQKAQFRTLVVRRPMVQLGDLFVVDDADLSATPVFHAPSIGESGRITPQVLHSVAVRYGINVSELAQLPGVIIKRANMVLSDEVIASAVKAEVLRSFEPITNGTRLRVIFQNVTLGQRSVLGGDDEQSSGLVSVTDLRINKANGTFSALAQAAQCRQYCAPKTVRGRVEAVYEVPVLTRIVARGEKISESDVVRKLVAQRRLVASTLMEVEDLVSMVARRRLMPDQPLVPTDVKPFALVHANDAVTIHFSSGSLNIAVQGTALDEGAKSQLIRVRNNRSMRIIQARVLGSGKLEVRGVQ